MQFSQYLKASYPRESEIIAPTTGCIFKMDLLLLNLIIYFRIVRLYEGDNIEVQFDIVFIFTATLQIFSNCGIR